MGVFLLFLPQGHPAEGPLAPSDSSAPFRPLPSELAGMERSRRKNLLEAWAESAPPSCPSCIQHLLRCYLAQGPVLEVKYFITPGGELLRACGPAPTLQKSEV